MTYAVVHIFMLTKTFHIQSHFINIVTNYVQVLDHGLAWQNSLFQTIRKSKMTLMSKWQRLRTDSEFLS